MKIHAIKQILLAVLVISSCLILAGCSEDKAVDSGGSRIVGDLSKAATLLEVVLPADCSDVPGPNSNLTGQLNNVDLNEVKVVMYSMTGDLYGNIRVFANDGSFSMGLPCGRRVRLVLANSDWTPEDNYDGGPPDIADSVLAVFWDIDRVVGQISGSVEDAFDSDLLEGVVVSWLIGGTAGSDTTGVDGVFSVGSNVDPGTYSFLFTKTGYALMYQDAIIPSLEELRSDNDSFPGDLPYIKNMAISLPPLSASLSGQIRLIDPISADTVAAANIPIWVELNPFITPSALADTTDANGFYNFDQVPAADTVSLVIHEFEFSNTTYGPIDSTLELFPGTTVINAFLAPGGGGSFRLISEPDRR